YATTSARAFRTAGNCAGNQARRGYLDVAHRLFVRQDQLLNGFDARIYQHRTKSNYQNLLYRRRCFSSTNRGRERVWNEFRRYAGITVEVWLCVGAVHYGVVRYSAL